MNNHDLMRDPFYAQLMYVIETAIHKADKAAQEQGVRLNDSAIKSALNKARKKALENATVQVESLKTREDFIEELARSIAVNRTFLAEEMDGKDERNDISRADWIKTISGVEDSLKLRRSGQPGGRDYLDFLRRFLKDGEVL